MTDFIHEQPKEEKPTVVPQEEEPELSEKTGQKRVYGYIFILFIVAFSLLLWAFFMNQRGTDQVLSELRGNADALQTTLTRNAELEREVDELEVRIETLTKEKAALEQSAAEQQKVVDQLGEDIKSLDTKSWLCYALLLMDDGDHDAAARALASWGSANDYQAVIEAHDNGSWNDAEAPVLLRERYDAMLEQLVKEGYLTVAQDGSLKYWHVDVP